MEDEVLATDDRVKVVGLSTYLEAGGSVRCDLFSQDAAEYLTDPALLDYLMGARLEEEAALVRNEGWSWVEIVPVMGHQERAQFSFPRKQYLPETAQVQAARVALEDELSVLEEKMNEAEQDGDDVQYDAYDQQSDVVQDKLEALQETLVDLSEIDKAQMGAVITLQGANVCVLRALGRRSDQQSPGAERPGGRVEAKSVRAEVPESLMLNLSSHRTAAIQALMSKNEQVTLTALAHKMALSTFSEFGAQTALKISLTRNRSMLEKNAQGLPQSRAAIALDEQYQAWRARLPEDSKDWFTWLLDQPKDLVLALIVFATSQCLDAVQVRPGSHDEAAPIAQALSLDMADWWEPTPVNYLELVPKARLMEMVSESCGAQTAEEMAKMKKGDAVAFANARIEGKRWVPAPLRSVSAPAAIAA